MQKALTGLGAVLMLGVSGCATVAGLAPGQGRIVDIHATSFATVWEAAMDCVSRDLTIVRSNKNLGRIEAKHGFSFFSGSSGEVVGVFISRPGDSGVSVEVVSKRRLATEIFTHNWEVPIIECIQAESANMAEDARTR